LFRAVELGSIRNGILRRRRNGRGAYGDDADFVLDFEFDVGVFGRHDGVFFTQFVGQSLVDRITEVSNGIR
jgi:hypothetical protein